jgi:monoamine oxidase
MMEIRGAPPSRTEVVVVGGGLAGLAAARRLAEHGIQVVILEAHHRVGGRAHTLYEGHAELPVECGPEFVHGVPAATHELAREAELELDTIAATSWRLRGNRLVPADDVWKRFGELLASAPDAAHDQSARSFIDHARLPPEDAQRFVQLVEGFYGAPIEDISVASIAADASGLGSAEARAQRVVGGYGRIVQYLVAKLARAGGHVHEGCFVQAIDWRRSPVEIEFRRGGELRSITADCTVVTLPLGVINQPDVVRFEPTLGERRAVLAQLAMGQVVKVVICLRGRVWMPGAPNELAFVHGTEHGFPTYWMRTGGGAQQLTAWAGGRYARALAGLTYDARVERALDGFAAAVDLPRGRLAAAVRDSHAHDFNSDPCARGAYSYTRVGGYGAGDALARPLAGRLFFAGEATDRRYQGTVAGALASGVRVAREVADRLRGSG